MHHHSRWVVGAVRVRHGWKGFRKSMRINLPNLLTTWINHHSNEEPHPTKAFNCPIFSNEEPYPQTTRCGPSSSYSIPASLPQRCWAVDCSFGWFGFLRTMRIQPCYRCTIILCGLPVLVQHNSKKIEKPMRN